MTEELRKHECAAGSKGFRPLAFQSFRLFNSDLLRLFAAEGEVVAAEFELQRVAQRRGAHKSDGGTRQQAHLTQAQERRASFWKILHATAGAER